MQSNCICVNASTTDRSLTRAVAELCIYRRSYARRCRPTQMRTLPPCAAITRDVSAHPSSSGSPCSGGRPTTGNRARGRPASTTHGYGVQVRSQFVGTSSAPLSFAHATLSCRGVAHACSSWSARIANALFPLLDELGCGGQGERGLAGSEAVWTEGHAAFPGKSSQPVAPMRTGPRPSSCTRASRTTSAHTRRSSVEPRIPSFSGNHPNGRGRRNRITVSPPSARPPEGTPRHCAKTPNPL